MKITTLLIMLVFTQVHAETPEDWGAIRNLPSRDEFGGIYDPVQSKYDGTLVVGETAEGIYWELTLIDVDGKFIDFRELQKQTGVDLTFPTRESCMRQAIYRMKWAIDNRKIMVVDSESTSLYTQYLGFICEEEGMLPEEPEPTGRVQTPKCRTEELSCA